MFTHTDSFPRALRQVPDAFQSFLVQGAHFTPAEEYPIITAGMIASVVPKKIMPFDKAISYRSILKDTFISFYSPDRTFERVRETQSSTCASLNVLPELSVLISVFIPICP